VKTLGGVQIDPLNPCGRNQDLALWSRVAGFEMAHLDELLHTDRAFFDYGELLFLYPIAELPYWRLHMRRRAASPRWAAGAERHAEQIEHVKAELRARGPLGNRDFAGTARVNSYRGSKDSGLALYYLWLTGELMTHSRRNFQRLFGFREDLVPASREEVSDEEAEAYFARKALSNIGLATPTTWGNAYAFAIGRRPDRAEARRTLDALVESGFAARIAVEGIKEPYVIPAGELPHLAALSRGDLPAPWTALDGTTGDEVTFIAPLDPVIHNRARAEALFGFEYRWEVYVPEGKRRWGYYTLPILYGDRLVGRIDPKLERRSRTLALNGFWLEDESLAGDDAFVEALGRGLARFARFNDARLADRAERAVPRTRRALRAALRQAGTNDGR
jgi:uncharacterized protein YcaQ